MTTSTQPSLHALQSLAARVALRAAAFAAGERERGVRVAASKSTPTDLVTEADRATEALIRAELADARPGDGFYGEESGRTHSETGLTWVVDPIDGTVNYTYAIPAWAVSIAVVQGPADPARWRTLAGAVVNPALGELWQARAGGGAELVQLGLTTGKVEATVQRQPPQDGVPGERERIEGLISETVQVVRGERFAATVGQHCRYCDFEAICPAMSTGPVVTQ